MMQPDRDIEAMNYGQRLKAATYYTIKKIAREVEEDSEATFSPQVLATLNESLHRQAAKWVSDTELFSKHAKRTEINVSDVRLVARSNASLLSHLDGMIEDMEPTENEAKKTKGGKTGRGRPKKNKQTVPVVDVAVVDIDGDE